MLTRVVGIPAAALIVLVAAPSLVVRAVGSATGSAPAAQQAAPLSASLKIDVAGERGGKTPLILNVRARDPVPPTATLVDDSGTHTATVAPFAGSCAKERVHDTLTGTDTWCLSITSLDAGHVLSGTLKGGTSLALTLTRRHALWAWPLLVLLIGLLAPLAVGLFKAWLQKRAGLDTVSRLIGRNPEIVDLKSWADDRTAAGMGPGDLLQQVERIAKAPPKLLAARQRLAARLATSTLPADHPFFVAAKREADRTDYKVADTISENGTAKAARAAEFLDHLEQLEADFNALEDLVSVVRKLVDSCVHEPLAAVVNAQTRFDLVEHPEDVAALNEPITEALAAVNTALATDGCLQEPASTRAAHRSNLELYLASSKGSERSRHTVPSRRRITGLRPLRHLRSCAWSRSSARSLRHRRWISAAKRFSATRP